ncbi:Peroxisome biogenesis protein 7 [Smittium culicis]|uniref:Peroxin-7 n=1 Tax=Smittium culicis TaxID=133412 RepID=A0A1R1YB86_9FUNG|nr:Peroxisome biogenesis protein 7 [Smittium culicis]
MKQWSPTNKASLKTISEHQGCVYDTAWNPRNKSVFASCAEDKTIKIHDLLQPHPVSVLQGHVDQVISVDWNKYDNNLLISSSSDKSTRVWDIRNPKYSVIQFGPFEFPKKKVMFSPHHKNIAVGCGYDMCVTFWNLTTMQPIYNYNQHKEFIFGIDWNLFCPDLVTTYSWDEHVNLIRVKI